MHVNQYCYYMFNNINFVFLYLVWEFVLEKTKILQSALHQLNECISKASGDAAEISEQGIKLDGNTLILKYGEASLSYEIFIQPWAPQKDIDSLITQIKLVRSEVILFADFVNPVMAEKFRRRSISFVDTAGNLFLKDKRLNFMVKGKKISNLRAKHVRGRAFNAAGLKLIFAIFNKPSLLHATYREISKEVNIALGSVGPVMDDLYASGYVLDDGRRRLVNKKRLFERWVDGYLEKLRPKQLLSCYTSQDENWWKQADPVVFGGVWGGDVVVAKSTPFMVPETVGLYFFSDEKISDFSNHYGLKEDNEGEICLYKTFWSTRLGGENGISPMIMYADIVDSINPGNWDVAKTFYGEAVGHLLGD